MNLKSCIDDGTLQNVTEIKYLNVIIHIILNFKLYN